MSRLAPSLALLLLPLGAAAFNIVGPPGSGHFGHRVAALPNGNIVVTDPDFSGGVGAAYLYSSSGTLISALTGTIVGDRVGDGGIVVLANGNYVIQSPGWSNAGATAAGAVTFGLASTGVSGPVSAANSLVGTSADDAVGELDTVALTNGNYVVPSQDWSAPGAAHAGAVTWGSGTTGVAGAITASNSLVGGSADDQVGTTVIALANGNYVAAANGWDDGAHTDAGHVTWGDGATGVRGVVSVANSMIGPSLNDSVGDEVVALSNGNYVFTSPDWQAGVGAVTWGDGTHPMSGYVGAANSLTGAQSGDHVGSGGVTALSNGNYVVASPDWANGGATRAGAATWRGGAAASPAVVGIANSLVGGATNDAVASTVTALVNGHYVVCSPFWSDTGLAHAGAATWGNGAVGTQGLVSSANSLAGEKAGDFACATSSGRSGVVALSNGNYVVISFGWNDGSTIGVGAVTWRSGGAPSPGRVTKSNSLTGSIANDFVGNGGAVALANGNYVVRSFSWDDGATIDAGAATWGSGTGPTSGALSSANSLVGAGSSGSINDPGILALTNGNYVVTSLYWGAGLLGAATVGDGAHGSRGAITAANSLTGAVAQDSVSNGRNIALPNGGFVIGSRTFNNGGIASAGAVTVLPGAIFASAKVDAADSVLGTVANGGNSIVYDWDAPRERLIVGLPAANRVTVRVDGVFRDGFE